MLNLLHLFLVFFKIGLFTFGGGYAMIPLIREEVLHFNWLDENTFLSFIAVAESTPGPIAINMATFIGSSQMGVLGALFATLGVVTPSFIIILLIASVIRNFLKFKVIENCLQAMRPIIVGLITATGMVMVLNVLFSLTTINNGALIDFMAIIIFFIIAVINFVIAKFTKKKLSPIILILISAILGIILYSI